MGNSTDGEPHHQHEPHDQRELHESHKQHMTAAMHRRAEAVKLKTQQVVKDRQTKFTASVVKRFFRIGGTRQGMLIAFNMFIGFFPLAIIGLALASKRAPHLTIGERIVNLIGLKGETAATVVRAFPAGSKVLVAASLISVGSLLLCGLDVANGVGDAYAKAWDVPPRKGLKATLRGFYWYLLVLAQFWLILLVTRSTGDVAGKRLIGIPLLAFSVYRFWLATPRLLLDQQIPRKDLRKGALVGVGGTAVLAVIAEFLLPGWFTSYTNGFGAVGVALAVISFLYVVGIVWTLVVVVTAILFERDAPIADVVALGLNDDSNGSDDNSDPDDTGVLAGPGGGL